MGGVARETAMRRFSRKYALLAAGAAVFQWTACLGPDPAGFLEDTLTGALATGLFSVVFSTLFAAGGA
jgi:hypothetical protein